MSESSKTYPFIPLDFKRFAPKEQLEGSQHFLETMRQRRTVREYSREPVPFELIENAIRAAGTAPSGANQQPWTFVVVSDPEIKRQIRLAAEAEEKISYEGRMSPEWLEALAPLGTDWRKPHLEDAPYLIVVFEQAYGLSYDDQGQEKKKKHYYAQESVGIAVGFLLAALAHSGLVTLTHTPSPMGFLRDILKRPPNERAFVVIPVGYPAPDAKVPDIKKKPLDEIMVKF
jgi:nitroreductase